MMGQQSMLVLDSLLPCLTPQLQLPGNKSPTQAKGVGIQDTQTFYVILECSRQIHTKCLPNC